MFKRKIRATDPISAFQKKARVLERVIEVQSKGNVETTLQILGLEEYCQERIHSQPIENCTQEGESEKKMTLVKKKKAIRTGDTGPSREENMLYKILIEPSIKESEKEQMDESSKREGTEEKRMKVGKLEIGGKEGKGEKGDEKEQREEKKEEVEEERLRANFSSNTERKKEGKKERNVVKTRTATMSNFARRKEGYYFLPKLNYQNYKYPIVEMSAPLDMAESRRKLEKIQMELGEELKKGSPIRRIKEKQLKQSQYCKKHSERSPEVIEKYRSFLGKYREKQGK